MFRRLLPFIERCSRPHAVIFGTVLLVASLAPPSVDQSGHAEEQARTPLEITADSMVAESRKNVIIFEGSVIVRRDGVTLSAERMVVHYGADRSIEKIDAQHDVSMKQDDREIRSAKAVYLAADESVVFTGDPVFREDRSTVTGTKITFYLKEERSVVENSRVILNE